MRGAWLMAGWLGVVLPMAGCDDAAKPAGTFDEAAVRTHVEALRDAWQRGDAEKICSLRGRNAVIVATQQPLRPDARPLQTMLTGEQACALARESSAWPGREVQLLDMTIEMADDGTKATVVAGFRESVPLDGRVTESRVTMVLGTEAGRLVTLREDISIRVVQSRPRASPAPNVD
jgi:hypothetical protein